MNIITNKIDNTDEIFIFFQDKIYTNKAGFNLLLLYSFSLVDKNIIPIFTALSTGSNFLLSEDISKNRDSFINNNHLHFKFVSNPNIIKYNFSENYNEALNRSIATNNIVTLRNGTIGKLCQPKNLNKLNLL